MILLCYQNAIGNVYNLKIAADYCLIELLTVCFLYFLSKFLARAALYLIIFENCI